MEANAAAYRRAVQASAAGECWDFLVLTAANEKQAAGYRHELALRERCVGPAGAFFPQVQRTLVVPDPSGVKVGSGGATLGVLRALREKFGVTPGDLDRLRILVIHSGGMSQRLPMYSALGKIFAPLPLLRPDGQIATLFDHLYLTLAGLPERLGPGMLVLAGDVFLVFDHRQVTAPPPGVTAISMRVDAEIGRGHGVFVSDDGGRILRTLQKVSVAEMHAAGATDAAGRVLIDTGLLFFDPARVGRLSELSRKIPERTPIDLYDDVTAALAAETGRGAYRGDASRRRLWDALHDVPFHVTEITGEFLHLGTTRQFRDAMVGRHPSPAAALFQQNVLAHAGWEVPSGSRVYHSVLEAFVGPGGARDYPGGTLGEGALVEQSVLLAGSRISRGCVVSQVLNAGDSITLPEDLVLFQVPVRLGGETGIAHAVCGIDDDFKGRYAEGRCLYLNRPIEQWMRRYEIKPRDIWGGVPHSARTLWNARLFVVTEWGGTRKAMLALCRGRRATDAQVKAWRRILRLSMAQIVASVDAASLGARREVVAAHLQSHDAIDCILRREDRPADVFFSHYTTARPYELAADKLASGVRFPPSALADPQAAINQARALWTVSQLLGRPDVPPSLPGPESYERRAFEKVAEASELGHRRARRPRPRAAQCRLRPGVETIATAPARLDLAGGWSDTPPYCFERGGHVVNVAIDLDGRPPVTATVRTLAEPVLVLESRDLAQKVELSDGEAARAVDVKDVFALHKVGLRTAGLFGGAGSLREQLKSLGTGLHVTTEARVPKGSGLGTSSILAATLLAALHAAAGRKPSLKQLIEQTLLLEQRLGTGGGWQDQVGGVAPGVKSTLTGPGVPQQPKVEVLELSGRQLAALEERLVVYYSGQQRLARDILRRVMGRWLGREPAVVQLMNDLKRSAAALRLAMLHGNWAKAAGQINRYWQIKKELYPGSTTAAIDLLFLETRNDCLAAGLAGAGGGGFAYFLCRDARQAARLRKKLEERSSQPGSPGTVYSTRINREGLHVARVTPAAPRARSSPASA
jgi:fucokinase